MFKIVGLASVLAASAFAALPSSGQEGDAIWHAVHENPARSAEETARDRYRHPEELLRFAGLEPGMAVGEVNPGGGWYSRILAPFLRDKGRYVGLEHNPSLYGDTPYGKSLAAYPEKIAQEAALYGPNAVATWIPAEAGLPVAAGSLDAILVVRAMHNWYRRGIFDAALGQSREMLKADGVLIVVQHRADEHDSRDRAGLADKGRWKQSDLIAAIEAHGFKLVESSEMNANPKDSKDYAQGVWTLPPRYALGDQDRAKYAEIGESDRMTLKFVKAE